ncbi:hypothetical protein SBRCBS47491_007334 [Sporothrix bragantina]|uniref:Peptidase M20 dimerisation domain-containing protein n=1 Tax=Sporothrix bragantina TaxID=671064 RepID=A0ABP0CCE0_9PEZI
MATPNLDIHERGSGMISSQPSHTEVSTCDKDISKTLDNARKVVAGTVHDLESDLTKLSLDIHSHPEIGYEEKFAHDTISDFLEKQGFKVKRHAYGLDTSFEAESGSGGHLIVYCAEYDALPGIGHGCGHNLIAMSSVSGFIATARALKDSGKPGRVRILGTPAEEGGGGKVKLLEAGAFKDNVAAAIMVHAVPQHSFAKGYSGTSGFRTLASRRFRVMFHGVSSHAGAQPWGGRNALDAAVGAYATLSMLRQQIHPMERINAVIENGGVVPNIIPDYACMAFGVRSHNSQTADALYDRVKQCIDAGAIASGCKTEYETAIPYTDLKVNDVLCKAYNEEMEIVGEKILIRDPEQSAAGTDMGNVSHEIPGFHGVFGIPTAPGVPPHHSDFCEAAKQPEAQTAALKASRGMAMMAIRVLLYPGMADRVKENFNNAEEEDYSSVNAEKSSGGSRNQLSDEDEHTCC